MAGLDRWLRGVALAAAAIAGIITLAMMVLITIEVIQRSLFSRSFLFVEEYSGYMVLAVLSLGVGLALQDDALLRVDFIIDRIKAGSRRWLQLFYDICSLVLCTVLAYQFTIFAWRSYERGIFAPTPMMTPIYIPQAIIALGFVLLCIILIGKLVGGFAGRKPEKSHPEMDLTI
jgi:TRAP-type C4-dicarboxylate transport system permease small subunit